ncbi:unnamed protein product [Musa acuminata subsp. burmannicoides]
MDLLDILHSHDSRRQALITFSIATLFTTILCFVCLRKKRSNLPPGPRGFPVLGSLPFLDPDLHRWFADLGRVHGPVMRVRLGAKPCVVLSSASVAREVFRNHDVTFANHDVPAAARTASYGGSDLAWAAYGPHWRALRKVCVRELLSARRVEAVGPLRRREVRRMVAEVHSRAGAAVEVREVMFVASLNLLMSMVWGVSLEGEERERVGREFRRVSDAFMELMSRPNVSDFFPALERFDLQGVERRMRGLVKWLDRVFDPIIDSKLREMKESGGGEGCKDFLQVLLELLEKEDTEVPLTLVNIKALIMDLLGGGTDTTSATVEWAMAELLHNPALMAKAQHELDEVVGKEGRVEESHIPHLSYLHAVVKEALRLHPPLPLLVPHSPSQTTTVGGFTIPRGTAVFVNVWAIQRDPSNWTNPLEFIPERFLGADGGADYGGNNFGYIPFGSGRRICVGISLAEKMLMNTLASLLHSFDWHLPREAKIGLEEKFGLVLRKSEPLVAIPKPRLSSQHLYT